MNKNSKWFSSQTQCLFNYILGTINLHQGSAMENTSIDWIDQSVYRPQQKHVTFATSTAMKSQAEDVADNKILAVCVA